MVTPIHEQNSHICAVCHAKGTGCCLFIPGLESQMFGLTSGEIEAISNHTGLSPDLFTVQDVAGREFLDGLASIHPVFLNTMPGGQRFRLVLKSDQCFFLGRQGCTLPNSVRPLFCRLYPFWFTPKERLMVLTSDRCLAQADAASIEQVLQRMETNEKTMKKLFDQFTDLANQHYNRYQ